MSLYGVFKKNGENGFGYNTTAEQVTSNISLGGKNFLITGCTSGLGKETARILAMRGARIMGTARTKEKADEVCKTLGNGSTGFACELADPGSVRACIETIKKDKRKIDAIVCNAGIMALPKLEQAYGYELQFFTNHIGHFMLVTGILNQLADNGRVVMLSSAAHKMAPQSAIEFDNLDGKRNYKSWTAYGQSKMANLLFAKELSRRFQGTNKTANAVHPGVIQTNLGRHMGLASRLVFSLAAPIALKTIAQGAATQCYAATHPEMENISGKYLADCNVSTHRNDANDEELARKLWKKSEEIVDGLK